MRVYKAPSKAQKRGSEQIPRTAARRVSATGAARRGCSVGAARRGTMQQHALFGAAWRDAMQPSIHLGAARCGMEQASASSGAAQRDAARHMPAFNVL